MALWVFRTFPPVDLSTRVASQEVNIGMQGIMGISYYLALGVSILSLDRYVLWHYGYSVLVHLSTCQPVNQGRHVQM